MIMEQKIHRPGSWLMSVPVLFSLLLFSCGEKRSDETIRNEITQQLQQGQNTAYRNVAVAVEKGKVNLTGECEGEHCADSVAAKVKAIEGVDEVENNVKEVPAQTDLTMRTSVQSIISKYQGVQADVAGGHIVLRGTILRDQIQPLMNELSTLNAKKIDNQLAIQ